MINQFAVGSEVLDRPVLDGGRRGVARGAADLHGRTVLRLHRCWNQLSGGECGESGQRATECRQGQADQFSALPLFLLVVGHVGNPTLRAGRIGRLLDRMKFFF
ncbi:hypothetical protein [Streptomyces griseorubiginosus]|uniref:hypothetical protein n=1 Tax=Streptomyces griseorubiginosus TaxID=67304 RepID=UPI0036607701